MSCENCENKSTQKKQPIYFPPYNGLHTASGLECNAFGTRHQHDWMVVDEPNFEMTASQASNAIVPSHVLHSFRPSMPQNGVCTRYNPQTGDNIQTYQRAIMKNGKVVGGEEINIYTD